MTDNNDLPVIDLTGKAAVTTMSLASNTSPPHYTGSVLVQVRAASAKEAMEFGRKLKNFKLDESYGPIEMGSGTWLIKGTASGEVTV